jgi:predicted Fe-Mo cluster-binding NifX family protein
MKTAVIVPVSDNNRMNAKIAEHFGSARANFIPEADFNDDDNINLVDFVTFAMQYSKNLH